MIKGNNLEEADSRLSRREWLQLTVATGTAGLLAGCGSNEDPDESEQTTNNNGGDNNQDTNDDSGDSSMVDQPWRTPIFTQPTKAQWNGYNTSNQPGYGWPLMWLPLAWYETRSGEFVPFLASDWEWVEDGNHFRMHLADFFTWHNGDPVTAQDVVTKLKLEMHLGGLGEQVDSVEAVDDHTVDVFTTNTMANRLLELIFFTFADPRYIDTPHSVYGDLLAAIEDSEPDTDARDQALADITQFRFEEPVGNGPLAFSEALNDRIVLEPHGEFPRAQLQEQISSSDHIDYTFPSWANETLNHPGAELKYFNDRNQAVQAFFTSGLDGGSVPPPEGPEILEQYPDTFTMNLTPSYRGSALCFKLDDPVFGEREVRKAIAHVIPVESVAQTTYGATGFAEEYATGLPRGLIPQWLSDEFLGKITSYVEQDFDAANAEMEASKFEKSDGKWRDGNGDPIAVELSAPSTVPSHINAMQKVKSFLNEFGFESEVRGIEGTQFWSKTMPEGDWTVAQNYFGGAQPHPYYAYHNTWISGYLVNDQHSPPEEVTVPSMDGSGEMTVNTVELVRELGKPLDEERGKEVVEKLAWTWNQTLPYVSYAERHNAWVSDHKNFKNPHPDDKAATLQRNSMFLHSLGTIKAREEPISEYPYDTRYMGIDGTSIDGGTSLEESKK